MYILSYLLFVAFFTLPSWNFFNDLFDLFPQGKTLWFQSSSPQASFVSTLSQSCKIKSSSRALKITTILRFSNLTLISFGSHGSHRSINHQSSHLTSAASTACCSKSRPDLEVKLPNFFERFIHQWNQFKPMKQNSWKHVKKNCEFFFVPTVRAKNHHPAAKGGV